MARCPRAPLAVGTGLSSFGYLKHYSVDFLKIDGSFVKGVLYDPIDGEMMRSIIEVLRGLGVDYAQGYGVSQPRKVQRAAIA